MDYDPDYENSLHYSPRFQDYADSLAQGLIDKFSLHGKDIIEIGCGKGDFLKALCKLGNNTGVGFDPSFEDNRDGQSQKNFSVIKDFYSDKYSSYGADLICCRHVLEHIQYPAALLNTVKKAIGDRLESIVFFEVPDGAFTLKDMGIWDLIYEHCSYFTSNSLSYAFSKNGYTELGQESAFDGQFLGIEAKLNPTTQDFEPARFNLPKNTGLATAAAKFATNYQEKVSYWKKQLNQHAQTNKKVVLWGAGSKGVTFLNVMKSSGQVEYIVDINPHKQGKFVAGSGQEIVSPEFLKTYQPDIVLVMNPIYQTEIQESLNKMGLNATCHAV
ncbi:MAG: SAM-dependent methyltransferase [Nitrosomonas sp.]|nr:MAG: SAM-dependent methyltransferase [Nitrosomonas sp.]